MVPSPKIVINFPRTYEKLPLKENQFGSAVSESFGTDRHTPCYYIIRILNVPWVSYANR